MHLFIVHINIYWARAGGARPRHQQRWRVLLRDALRDHFTRIQHFNGWWQQ